MEVPDEAGALVRVCSLDNLPADDSGVRRKPLARTCRGGKERTRRGRGTIIGDGVL